MWKTIQFENCYEVNERGEVRNRLTGHVKSTRLSRNGYERVTLYPSGKTYFIHTLVAETWLEKGPDSECVNHKDGNKLNNHVSNLEWTTSKRNFEHAVENGLYIRPDFSGTKNPMSKFTEEDLEFIVSKSGEGWTTSQIAKELNVPYERVRRFVVGQHYK